jgi:hypothetical protein
VARLHLASSSSNILLKASRADSNSVDRLARVSSLEARRHHHQVLRTSVNTFVS